MALNNTAIRILVSVVTIPLILFVSYVGGIYFFIMTLAIGSVSFYEFSLMTKNKNGFVQLVPGLIAVIALVTNFYKQLIPFEVIVIGIPVVLLLIELFRNRNSAIANLGATLLGIFYIGLCAATIVGIREFFKWEYINGGYLIISVLITIWVCDSAAFFIGTAIGKHKLFPRVSPKKSWEGAVAGFVFSVVSMIVLKYLLLQFLTFTDIIIMGLIVGTIGQLGDLVESLLKRDAGVKDSSSIIPGHGGIFDRFDSFLFSSPAIYLYLLYFVK
jgi:phosphatidate cytidylyltransferase